MNRVALVSGSDENYYPLLIEWLKSVKSFEQSNEYDICIIDSGLNRTQLEELKSLGVDKIVNPDWPCNLPSDKIKGKEYLKSCVCRPFIPKIFPDYDAYVWMDSDTWVQNWRGVDVFAKGALEKTDSLIITSAADRHYEKQFRSKWFWHWPYKLSSFYFSNAKRAFGFKTAKKLVSKYVLFAGCFAISGNAPHWNRWQELVVEAMKKGKLFTAEQLSLGVMVYNENYKYELLPAYLHWVCDTQPAWDEDSKQFIEPFLPNEPISIMHLSGVDEMRSDHNFRVKYKTKAGNLVELNCRYPQFDGGIVGAPKRA